jgi:hypothetical protein
VLSFPPGYLLAIRYNLGILLAPDYGRQVAPEVIGRCAVELCEREAREQGQAHREVRLRLVRL